MSEYLTWEDIWNIFNISLTPMYQAREFLDQLLMFTIKNTELIFASFLKRTIASTTQKKFHISRYAKKNLGYPREMIEQRECQGPHVNLRLSVLIETRLSITDFANHVID